MATRIYFMSTPHEPKIFKEKYCDFKYHSGFAISQKHKNIIEFHAEILKKEPNAKLLEVSTKSKDEIGIRLSAFNLKYYHKAYDEWFPLENIFQSSKVFEGGGPYRDLLHVSPKDAKRDDRLQSSGKLIHFDFNSKIWDLNPKSMFYDWIYMRALSENKKISEEILKYNCFTDIEFNHNKSINSQARSAAIFVSLSKLNILNKALEDIDFLRGIYSETRTEQLTFKY